MAPFKTFKKNAKLTLRGNWGTGAGVLLIVTFFGIVCSLLQQLCLFLWERFGPAVLLYNSVDPARLGIRLLFSLVGFLAAAPLSLGALSWYIRLVHSRRRPTKTVLRYFLSTAGYRRSLWLHLQMSARTGLWAAVFFAVPSLLLIFSVYYYVRLPEPGREVAAISTVGITLAMFLFLLSTLLYLLYMQKYALVRYMVCEDDTLSVTQAFRLSIQFTGGYRISFFLFHLSFIGWLLLCVACPPVYLYAGPYFNAAGTLYARHILDRNHSSPANATREFVVGQDTDHG